MIDGWMDGVLKAVVAGWLRGMGIRDEGGGLGNGEGVGVEVERG